MIREDYIPPAYRRYSTQWPNQEVIGACLWDSLLYTSAATLQLVFFGGVRATLDVGNMEVAGQLAAPKAFLIRAVRWMVKQQPESVATAAATNPQPGAVDNVALLQNTGWLEMSIGAKQYVQLPLWAVPAGAGPFGQIAVNNVLVAGGAVDAGSNGFPDVRNVYTLARPLFLEPQVNFQVSMFWPAAVTLTRNVTLCVALEGDLIRPVQ